MVSQIGSSLSAVYQPFPAIGPSPLAAYMSRTKGSVPYEIPAVCVKSWRIVIWDFAGTILKAASEAKILAWAASPGSGKGLLFGPREVAAASPDAA